MSIGHPPHLSPFATLHSRDRSPPLLVAALVCSRLLLAVETNGVGMQLTQRDGNENELRAITAWCVQLPASTS
ncbi:hypothetical protein C8F01DRAFT_1172950 [Mycena amicta]|nr:hypothetical protein C8F01DRAFT_1172950 [Mycena amicta]